MKSIFSSISFVFLSFLFSNLQAQQLVDDPYRYPVSFGDRTLELVDWAQIPDSTSIGGGMGHARINIMRAIPNGRLYVNDQRGIIYEVEQGRVIPFLNVRERLPDFIDSPGLGAGLHAFAFHPDYLDNGKLYTVHTEPWNIGEADFKGPSTSPASGGVHGVVLEWTSQTPGSRLFLGDFREIMRIYFPGTLHGLQEVAFNPNAAPGDNDYGILYVLVGEGHAFQRGYWQDLQRLDSPLGTVMRIDPSGNNSSNGQYGIPDDNPWLDSDDSDVITELYAIGFRNPHRITWDTQGTGRAYIGDIGENWVEEINLLQAGADYGFPHREGTFVLQADNPSQNDRIFELPENDAEFGYTYPVAQYIHFPNTSNAIALGEVYRGSLFEEQLGGLLLFGDLWQGRVFAVQESELEQGRVTPIEELRLRLDGAPLNFRSFFGRRSDMRMGIDSDGELYIFTKTDGMIRKLVGAERRGAGLFEGQRGPRRIAGLGWVNDARFPWVYSARSGWNYLLSESVENLWMFNAQTERWLWTESAIYPWAFDPEEGWILIPAGD